MQLLLPSEYQEALETLFLSVRSSVLQAYPAARVEHVGSSAIPGAVSKGDLDICVLVAPEVHGEAVAALQSSGYTIKADTLRTPELCMLESPRQDFDVALQVVAEGSKFEFFLHFRDSLRGNPGLVQEYNQLKLQYYDRPANEYREAKAKFISSVLGLA
jgi:GrpB-like predicted nucleotidyltransferase (UPF0157 family)